MYKYLKRAGVGLAVLAFVMLAAGMASAQEDLTPKKRLNGATTVTGFIGGESHDSYVIRVRKGQRMTVEISWVKEDRNKAEFKVSESANFYGGEMVKYGLTTYAEDKWTGKVPKTGDLYVYVVAHPTAKYKLRVSFR